jgi:hypothetical protein
MYLAGYAFSHCNMVVPFYRQLLLQAYFLLAK